MEYTEDQLTEWFNFSEKRPDSPGVYEIKDPDFRLFSYWDGSSWHWGDYQPSTCNTDDPMISYHEENLRKFWRGLSTNPALPSAQKKRAGNKRKTMYVVMDYSMPVAAFHKPENADAYIKLMGFGVVNKIRFRTPEA